MLDKILKVFENNYVLALTYVVLCFLIVKLVDRIFKRITGKTVSNFSS